MSSPPPPPPRRARPDAGAQSPADASAGAPAPPPRRRDPDPHATAPAAPAAAVAAEPTAPVSPQSGPTRAERRTGSNGDDGATGGRRRGLVIAGVVAAVLIVGVGAAFALGAFSGGDDGGGGEEAAPKATNNVDLQQGEVTVYWPGLGPQNPTPPELPDQVMTAIGEYVDNGIVAGLRSGKVKDADLSSAFDEAALARLKSDDRGVVLDEGLPKAEGPLRVESNPTAIAVLNDAQGTSQVATATVGFAIRAKGPKGPYTIKRTGQLEFTPDATGVWKITGWDLDIERSGSGLPVALQTPTTAPPPTAPGTPTTVAAGPTTTAGTQ